MVEVRCSGCGRLLLKEAIRDGEIEIKCHGCNTMNLVSHRMVQRNESLQVLDSWQKRCNSETRTVRTVRVNAETVLRQLGTPLRRTF
jgi:LSD1 subclass zinc finger protein